MAEAADAFLQEIASEFGADVAAADPKAAAVPHVRKRRWEALGGASAAATAAAMAAIVPGIPRHMPSGLSSEVEEALLLRIRIDEITRKLTTNQLDLEGNPENRSPSPTPMYDTQGKRTNTRDQRHRERLMRERQLLIDDATRTNPQFRPPADFKPMLLKKSRKLPVPRHPPDYNYIGLIIGPRGNTQKRMERETGAKIAIRGKGSIKEGKGRRDGKSNPGEDEDTHVLITADTEEQLARAVAMVEPLLVPVEEGRNDHKRKQLRELAEINGTLRDRTWGEDGGPGGGGGGFGGVDVFCQICGEVSHPTSDCPAKDLPEHLRPAKRYEEEYAEFRSEIDSVSSASGGPGGSSSSSSSSSAPPPPPPPPSSSGGGHPPPPPPGAGGGYHQSHHPHHHQQQQHGYGGYPPPPPGYGPPGAYGGYPPPPPPGYGPPGAYGGYPPPPPPPGSGYPPHHRPY